MQKFPTLFIALGSCLFASSLFGAALTPGNILISTDIQNQSHPNSILEYTPSGVLVQSFPIPFPRGDDPSGSSPGGLAVSSNGNIQIFDGVFNAYLATLNPISGVISYNQGVGFGGVGQAGRSSLTTLGNYAYVTDQLSAMSSHVGLVRFDLTSSSSQRFFDGDGITSGTSFIRISTGLDGYLYGTPDSGHSDKIDPSTMQVVQTVQYGSFFLDQVVADANGDLYMSGEGFIRHFKPDGTLVKSIQVPFGAPFDMELSPSGKIVICGTDVVGITDTSLSSISTFAVTGASYVGFTTPTPEPATILVMMMPLTILLVRRSAAK